MKQIFILIISLSFFIAQSYSQGIDSISLTYIANCGFLIEIDSQKIIVDGLFKSGHGRYPTPDSVTQDLLIHGIPPFNNINLILVSHKHQDHFDSEMVTKCMLVNSNARLICPQQVIDILSENTIDYDKIKARIIECTPNTFTSQSVQVGPIEVIACRFAHRGEKHKGVHNIGYFIILNGKSVFHTADADPIQIDKFTGFVLHDKKVDVALLNEDLGNIKYTDITKKHIHATNNVAMHLPDKDAEIWSETIKDNPDLFSNPFIFTKSLERKVFNTGIKK